MMKDFSNLFKTFCFWISIETKFLWKCCFSIFNLFSWSLIKRSSAMIFIYFFKTLNMLRNFFKIFFVVNDRVLKQIFLIASINKIKNIFWISNQSHDNKFNIFALLSLIYDKKGNKNCFFNRRKWKKSLILFFHFFSFIVFEFDVIIVVFEKILNQFSKFSWIFSESL